MIKRYQVYLDKHDVDVLDEFEEITDINRSVIIRDAVSAVASNLAQSMYYQKFLQNKKNKQASTKELPGYLRISGIAKDPTGQITNHAIEDEEIPELNH